MAKRFGQLREKKLGHSLVARLYTAVYFVIATTLNNSYLDHLPLRTSQRCVLVLTNRLLLLYNVDAGV